MVAISRVTQSDISTVKALLSETWRDTYGDFLPEDVIAMITENWHRPEALWAEAQRSNTYFGVARLEEDQIVGLITMRILDDGHTAYLSRLYVHPSRQRQGIGEALLRAASEAFPAVKHIHLEVEEQNYKGRAFYAKCGFVHAGSRREEIAGIALNTLVLEKEV